MIAVLWALGAVLPLVCLGWAAAESGHALPPLPDDPAVVGTVGLSVQLVIETLIFVPLAFAGAALVARPAAPLIGWVMLAVAAASGLSALCIRYAARALVVDDGSLPFGELAAVASPGLTSFSLYVTGTALLLLVPTGGIASVTDRRIALVCLAAFPLQLASVLTIPGPLANFGYLENPIGLKVNADAAVLNVVAQILFHACVVTCAVRVWRQAATLPGQTRLLRRVAVLAIVVSVGGGLIYRFDVMPLAVVPPVALLALLVEVTLFTARRSGLWGMPSLLHRSAAWLIASTVLVVVYGALVTGIDALSSGLATTARVTAIVVAALLASAAQVLATRVLARRLLGDGSDPRSALVGLLGRLGAASAAGDAPQVLADAAARAVRPSSATVTIAGASTLSAGAGSTPRGPLARTALPIVHGGTVVGTLALEVGQDVVLTSGERRTLVDMARFAAPSVHAAGLLAAHDPRSQPVRDELLRLDLVDALDEITAQLDDLDAKPPPVLRETVDELHTRTAELIEQVRAVSRSLRH